MGLSPIKPEKLPIGTLVPNARYRGKWEIKMDRCPHCNKRMKTILGPDGRTDFRCLECDKIDPLETDAVKWAESPLAAPTKAA
jgi:tRNA(Ile2) C34 agmatinyltransferase TiaS